MEDQPATQEEIKGQEVIDPPVVEDEETKAMRLHNAQCPQAYMLMFNVQK